MTCKYLIGTCFKTHLPCPHVSINGECDEAACSNAVVPTWQELLDIYEAAKKPTTKRMAAVRSCVERFVATLGFEMKDKVAVTDAQIDEAYDKLLVKYSPYTVESTFQSIGACIGDSREVKREYRNRQKVAPSIEFPQVKKQHPEPASLTVEQRVKLKQIMMVLRASDSEVDHRRFIWAWFAWRTGMRPSDIQRVTWSCIQVHSNGSVWIDYVPHKTDKSTGGKRAGGKLPEEDYEEIRPFIGKPDEPVIKKFENRRPKSGYSKITNKEYIGMCLSLREWFSDTMKSIGVVDRKPAYVARKDCGARITSLLGPVHAAQMLGDNLKTMLKHYVNLHKTELKEGL